MKIVILGAGKVGTAIIDNFIEDECDIVVVDLDASRLALIAAKYDLVTICGHANDLAVLDRADLKSADLLVAATQDDEVNMLACKIAHELYNVEFKIARIRERRYLEQRERLFKQNIFPVDYIIEPTLIMAKALYNLIRYPGTEYFNYFCENKLALFACQAQYGGIFVGKVGTQAVNELRKLDIALVALIRNQVTIQVNEYTTINAGDQVVLLAEPDNVMLAMSYFQKNLPTPKRIMLAGGSRTNYFLAQFLRAKASIKLFEADKDKAYRLVNELSNVLVIEGDCTDENLLFEERIDSTDIYVATTGQDNVNIMSALLAKRMGAKRALAVVGRTMNKSLIHNDEIDIIYTPQNDLATELRAQGKITAFERVFREPNNLFQVFEVKLGSHFTHKNSEVACTYEQLKLPQGIKFLGVYRKGSFKVISGQTPLNPGDQIIGIGYSNDDLQAFTKLHAKPIYQI
ncbi:Trk system potassium transporter TrkA [Psittacicella gerlachiana]|uniref:Trk system potassium uptake protein TrkA n=1 Tax=Psittacicella gerlachiana TaxID=2028574 RepID=A0A3A1YNA5_9GAMM|nr:Trk system potassium transporter TrkA [Psittacicella gerlachiana]RIY38709.1 Trk system potassium transport protein TrkA [Psittacicella gerlachiana]